LSWPSRGVEWLGAIQKTVGGLGCTDELGNDLVTESGSGYASDLEGDSGADSERKPRGLRGSAAAVEVVGRLGTVLAPQGVACIAELESHGQ
jgi:hypothetical protein